MLQIQFDEEYHLLHTKLSGKIHFEDVEEHYSHIFESHDLPRDLNVMIDARYAQFQLKPADIEMIVAMAAECLPKYKRISEAIVVDKPYETMVAMLFEESSTLPGYHFKTFSTIKAAQNWLFQMAL